MLKEGNSHLFVFLPEEVSEPATDSSSPAANSPLAEVNVVQINIIECVYVPRNILGREDII